MSTSVRVARRSSGLRLVCFGAGLLLAGGASMTALLAVASVAAENLAIVISLRPDASNAWRRPSQDLEASRRPVTRAEVASSVFSDRERRDDLFRSVEAAGRGDSALAARLAEAPLLFDRTRAAWREAALEPAQDLEQQETSLLQAPSGEAAQAASAAGSPPPDENVASATRPRVIVEPQPVQMASVIPASAPVEIAALEQAPAPMVEAGPSDAGAAEAIAEPVRLVPVPKPRPADFARMAQERPGAATRANLASVRLETPALSAAARPVALAYAASPDAETKGGGPNAFFRNLLDGATGLKLPGSRSGVAVYDIATATVRLPNGERLEAHSGLAHRQDNASYVREKNRGPTPPNVYTLRMREALFHGTEAIRLLPRDQKKVFNRDGLLAHPYMYAGGGSRSQSNGCVVFKDYARFLRAFKAGEIAKLVVVPNIGELNTYMAGL